MESLKMVHAHLVETMIGMRLLKAHGLMIKSFNVNMRVTKKV